LRVLVSTFREGDLQKLTLAMRQLPYDKLVVLAHSSDMGSPSLSTVRSLEEMAGHAADFEELDENDFLTLVDEISSILSKHSLDQATNKRNIVSLNMSGGSKILGDAALFAAFRLGIETYHCENRVTKLPVIRGATAKDRFTPMQIDLIKSMGRKHLAYEELTKSMEPASKQATDRLIRELKRQGILSSESRSAKIFVFLTEAGREVHSAVMMADKTSTR